MTEKIIIEITNTGETKVSVECGQGESCKTLTEGIEKALGKVVKDTPTPDMYKENHAKLKNFA